jgi:hypothetical protein
MTKTNSEGALFWAPRLILIFFAAFLMLFSFDVFEGASSAGEAALAFFMHNLPSIILLVILAISWKRDLVGGIIFLLLGLACLVGVIVVLLMAVDGKSNPIMIIGAVVFGLIGFLFIANWKKTKAN